jgi:hypothetical protein
VCHFKFQLELVLARIFHSIPNVKPIYKIQRAISQRRLCYPNTTDLKLDDLRGATTQALGLRIEREEEGKHR